MFYIPNGGESKNQHYKLEYKTRQNEIIEVNLSTLISKRNKTTVGCIVSHFKSQCSHLAMLVLRSACDISAQQLVTKHWSYILLSLLAYIKHYQYSMLASRKLAAIWMLIGKQKTSSIIFSQTFVMTKETQNFNFLYKVISFV